MHTDLAKTLKAIRDYPNKHQELKKSHHFLFNNPLDRDAEKADIVVIGLNPGECANDYYKFPKTDAELPTEESHAFNFHEAHEKGSVARIHWTKICKKYFPNKRIFQAEFFFWSSHDIGKAFAERFGYSFWDCPHFAFCRDCNFVMLRHHRPKLIVATGLTHIDFLAKLYGLTHIKTIKRTMHIVCHYEWEGIPFIFTPHWTGAHMKTEERAEMLDYLRQYV